MKRRVALVLLLCGLLPALACNMPVATEATPDVRAAVQQTLAALQATDSSGTAAAPAAPAEGLATFTALPPLPIVTVNAPTPAPTLDEHTFQYITQPGDTLTALSLRFEVDPEQIPDLEHAPPQVLLRAGQALAIPNTLSSVVIPAR